MSRNRVITARRSLTGTGLNSHDDRAIAPLVVSCGGRSWPDRRESRQEQVAVTRSVPTTSQWDPGPRSIQNDETLDLWRSDHRGRVDRHSWALVWAPKHSERPPARQSRPGWFSLGGIAGHRAANGAPAVTGLRTEVHHFRWDPQTCDGDPPGWAAASVDMTFRGSSTVPASLDALMGRLGWKQYEPAAPSSGPIPASPGPGFRVYEPAGANPHSVYASLTPPGTLGGGLWDLDVTSDQPEVPSHDC